MGPPLRIRGEVGKPSHLQLEPQRSLWDLGSPWLLTTYKSWDDPPNSDSQLIIKPNHHLFATAKLLGGGGI